MNKFAFAFLLIISSLSAYGTDNVSWTYSIKGENTATPSLEMTATIANGYHLYAIDNPEGGGMPLNIHMDFKNCVPDGKLFPDHKPTVTYNDIFDVNEHYFSNKVTYIQKLKALKPEFSIQVEIQGQVCNDNGCAQVFDSFTANGKGIVSVADENKQKNADKADDLKEKEAGLVQEETEMMDSLQATETLLPAVDNSNVDTSDWWRNVETELNVFNQAPSQQERSLLYIFIAGFIGGLIALVTPCVWPMIPMTVSFFLKQNKNRAKAVKSAAIYGVSIIVIYVLLGLCVTAIFGASALNELATSAGFNIAFFILLVIFAISFMGGFELTLPASWSNKIDSKADATTGYISIFFMAFTLSLVSFSCTGPIIGTLLVEAAATSNFISPAVGMFGFALALALPFSLFAIFPNLLKSAPKSGSWMNTVKVVLGFLELALALKFLSVADLAYGWHILDREVFIALWIVIFGLLGVYLLGKISFPHETRKENIGITRFMLAALSLAFSIYMLPGLWGAPLKSISAFTPPITTQDFNLYDGSVHAITDDFDEGMKLARESDKPLLIDFSGFGCVNCRKMEAAVWTNPEVKDIIDKNFILVSLMVDDKTPLPAPIVVAEKGGKKRTLRTVGEKWSYLERSKFGSNAQPYYVVLNNDGKPVSGSYGYNENISSYLNFLSQALKKFKLEKQLPSEK